jgi:leucyl aminopeptidase
MTKNVATETLRTIKFIGYTTEEVGLRRSKAIAKEYKNQGFNIIGVAKFVHGGLQSYH